MFQPPQTTYFQSAGTYTQPPLAYPPVQPQFYASQPQYVQYFDNNQIYVTQDPNVKLPPKGWVLSRLCIALAVLLLLTAVGLGIASVAGRSWLTSNDSRGMNINGLGTVSNKAQLRISLWKIYLKDNNVEISNFLTDFLKNVPEQNGFNSDYLNELLASIRACRAMIIIGIILSFFAALVALLAVIQTEKWQTYRLLRFIAAGIAFIAFAAFLICFIIWVVQVQKNWSTNQAPNININLKCATCDFGWPTWLDLVCFILTFLATLLLILAMEPKRESWKGVKQEAHAPTLIQTFAQAPPPTPVQSSSAFFPPQPMFAPQTVVEPQILVSQSTIPLTSFPGY